MATKGNAAALREAADEIERLQKALQRAREIASRQAEDEALWFRAKTAPEAYLQNALRELTSAIEATPNLGRWLNRRKKMTFDEWWDANEKQFMSDACHMSEYHMAHVAWKAATIAARDSMLRSRNVDVADILDPLIERRFLNFRQDC